MSVTKPNVIKWVRRFRGRVQEYSGAGKARSESSSQGIPGYINTEFTWLIPLRLFSYP